jgi:hypothetical protein
MGCPYANALGEPGKGVHSTRFLGFALNDTLMTIGAALLTAWIFNINVWKSLLIWFIVGELLHIAFGVDSAFLRMLGLTPLCIDH